MKKVVFHTACLLFLSSFALSQTADPDAARRIAEGTPEALIGCKESYTGHYLKEEWDFERRTAMKN